jgi:hypothetical protein
MFCLQTVPNQRRDTSRQGERSAGSIKHLRLANAAVYLRSGSINIINGMIGLTRPVMAATASITASSSDNCMSVNFLACHFSSVCH